MHTPTAMGFKKASTVYGKVELKHLLSDLGLSNSRIIEKNPTHHSIIHFINKNLRLWDVKQLLQSHTTSN